MGVFRQYPAEHHADEQRASEPPGQEQRDVGVRAEPAAREACRRRSGREHVDPRKDRR